MDLKKLIYNIQKGDSQAERIVYDYCTIHCFKTALIYTYDKAEAIDVFNHTMLYIFDHFHKLDKPENLLKWVHRILKNDCIDHIRKKTIYQNKLSNYKEEVPSTVMNEAMSNLAMEEIIQLIHQLKPTYRLCFILKEIDKYTFKEIATELAINENTAKWYLSEAKKILQKQLVLMGYSSLEKRSNGVKR